MSDRSTIPPTPGDPVTAGRAGGRKRSLLEAEREAMPDAYVPPVTVKGLWRPCDRKALALHLVLELRAGRIESAPVYAQLQALAAARAEEEAGVLAEEIAELRDRLAEIQTAPERDAEEIASKVREAIKAIRLSDGLDVTPTRQGP